MTDLPTSGADRPSPFEACGLSDMGHERAENEDAWLVSTEQGLLLVSDGMGGEAAGGLASQHVAEWLPLLLAEHVGQVDAGDVKAVEDALRDAIRVLNHRVRAEASNLDDGLTMGATLAMGLWLQPRLYVAHVGDSRAYLLRGERLARLTQDHSAVGVLLERGVITPDQVPGHPMCGQLTRYIGMGGNTGPDISRLRIEPGDLLLLSTDGLTAGLSDDEIARTIRTSDGLQTACQALIDAANAAGGRDNTTVVLARWPA